MEKATITFPIFGEGFALNPGNSFSIFGFDIYYYGLIIGIGFLLAVIYALIRAKDFGLTQDNIIDMLIFCVPLAIIGARLFYVVFDPKGLSYYLENPSKIFAIRDGGLAIYGGVIGAVAGALIGAKVRKISFGDFADLGGIGLLIGQTVGRMGNFFNREVYGRVTEVPWRMGLITETTEIYVHPTFLYEMLWNAVGILLLHLYTKRRQRRYSGQIFVFYLAWYGLGRAWIEGVRDPAQNLYLFNTGILVNMLLAILCVVGALAFHLFMLRRTPAGPQAAEGPAVAGEKAEAPETKTTNININSKPEDGDEEGD